MHNGYRCLFSAFVLTAALAASTSLSSAAPPQDGEHRDENHVRYYDRDHKDYHNWDDGEDRSYRIYLGEQHREYHPFAETKRREQQAYWNWRHSHPDHDHDGR
jgi:hypothetical protein